jgi:hypothetical protein
MHRLLNPADTSTDALALVVWIGVIVAVLLVVGGAVEAVAWLRGGRS